MSTSLLTSEAAVVSECECGWTHERDLDEKGFDVDVNQEIAERVARNHEFFCGENGLNGRVETRIDATGGR